MQVESAASWFGRDPQQRQAAHPFQTEIMALNLVNQDDGLPKPCSGPVPATCPIPARQGPVPRQHFLPRRQHVHCLPQAGVEDPDRRRARSAQDMYQIAKGKERHRLRHRRHGIGKTTSLAAILDDINERRSVHIVTLEDPVEYQHPHKKAPSTSVNWEWTSTPMPTACAPPCAKPQSDPGRRNARSETVEIGLSAAETGHSSSPRCTPPTPAPPSTASWACFQRGRAADPHAPGGLPALDRLPAAAAANRRRRAAALKFSAPASG